MREKENGFWQYYGKWRGSFPEKREVIWRDNWLDNSYCGDCRYCCGPQGDDEPFPMALLPRQIRADLDKDFYLLDASTAYIGAEGCKSETPRGCRLTTTQKPVACGLFPIVLANGALYLYQRCPAAIFTPLVYFLEIAKKAAERLNDLTIDELRHLSLKLPLETLVEKYIDLHARVFDATGKNPLLT